MRRILPLTAGTAAVALATLVVAAPASAATIASGQRISVVQNTLVVESGALSQQYDVDPATVAGTAIGAASQDAYPVTGIDVDDDGHGYALGRTEPGDGPRFATISSYDANTGTFGESVELDFEEFSEATCTGIDYQPGQYPIVSCKWQFGEGSGTFIAAVDPATGDYVGADAIWFANGTVEVDSIALQPGTSILWVFYTVFEDGDVHYVAPLDLATDDGLGDEIELTQEVRGADFDRDGRLFASVLDGEGDTPSLATIDLTTGDITEVGEFPFLTTGDGIASNISSLTVWGKPALAATGAEIVPVALGSALLLLAGAAFVATARLRRSA